MSGQCSSCSTALRPGARFCPKCGTPAAGGGGGAPAAQPAPGGGGGFTVTPPRPGGGGPPQGPPGGQGGAGPPKRGTVVREEGKRPGTVLYSQKKELPVCGWLVVLRGRRQGRDFRIEKDNSVLGRDGSCDYVVEDETVSREHCRIRREDDKFMLFDLGSGNGTYLNGEKVYNAELEDGDVLKVGESLILFKEAKPRVPLSQADVAVDNKPAD